MKLVITHVYRKNKFLYLLTALLAFLILNPIIVETKKEMFYFGILFTLVIIFCVYIIQQNRTLLISSSVFAVLVTAGFWASRLVHASPELIKTEYILTILFFMLMTSVVLKSVIDDRYVNVNTLCGAICGYFLIGMVCTYLYILIYYLDPNSFRIASYDVSNLKNYSQFFSYYSFTTQSTLGFGDITPVSKIAKMISWLQAVVGQIYLTVWIAQLVGLHIANKVTKSRPE